LRRPLDQEFGNDLAAAGRQITREIRNHVEQVVRLPSGLVAMATTSSNVGKNATTNEANCLRNHVRVGTAPEHLHRAAKQFIAGSSGRIIRNFAAANRRRNR